MGTPLADALADYRTQLAPSTDPGRRPRRWRRPVAGILVAAVLLAAGVLSLTRVGGSPSPGPADPVAGPPPPGPATGPTPPAPGEPAAESLVGVPPATGWAPWSTPVVRTWLPRVPGSGPGDPPARGFARTPTGALVAAATLHPLAYYAYPEAVWAQFADTRVRWAPGQREQLAAALAPVWTAAVPAPMVLTPVGYRVIVYGADHARFRLWWSVDIPDRGTATVGALVDVAWVDDDWALVFDEPAMDLRPLRPADTYLIWGPHP